jgi:hypothetical protein
MVKGAINPAILKAEKLARESILTEIAYGKTGLVKNTLTQPVWVPPRPFYQDMARPIEQNTPMSYFQLRTDTLPKIKQGKKLSQEADNIATELED